MEILIGLGGNVGDPPRTFKEALASLGRTHRVAATSSLYRSRPVGPPQGDFFNMAALLEATVDVAALLAECQGLEVSAGRDRDPEARWGPRPLDIDLLIAAGVVRRGPRVELPHPRLAERAFVLVPAAELVPDWVHPIVGRTIGELAEEAVVRDPDAVWRVQE
jgi:2-amino-4-hydroxy-6-hydroxymethyldihydropteridine diphosphokinase